MIRTEKSFRLRIGGKIPTKSIDLYFGTKQSIAMYHSAPTNCFFDGSIIWMYPRAFHFAATGVISDLVPLSRDRGLALRIKTYKKYAHHKIYAHIWHKEIGESGEVHRNYMVYEEEDRRYDRSMSKLVNWFITRYAGGISE